MIVIQDDDRGLIMQTMVKGQTILIDPQLISSVIGVPVLPVCGVPFPAGDETPNIDFLHDLFGTRPQREDKSHSQINIGAFAPMHQFLANVVVTNLWPQSRRSDPSICHSDADPFLLVQAHLENHSQGSRREKHESIFWVFNHSKCL
jgi:hypothetical protein